MGGANPLTEPPPGPYFAPPEDNWDICDSHRANPFRAMQPAQDHSKPYPRVGPRGNPCCGGGRIHSREGIAGTSFAPGVFP